MERKKVFRYCTEDRINNNILQKLRRNAREWTAKTDILQPPWWSESVNQAWVIKGAATKIWQWAEKNRIRNKKRWQSN